MDKTENRRARLMELISRYESQAEFVRVSGENQSEVSGLLKTKSFGEKKARKIEAAVGLPPEWLDQPVGTHGEDLITSVPERSVGTIPAGYVRLKLLDATPYMGAGGEPVDFPEVIHYVDVLREYLVTELRCNPDNIDLLPTNGDSMKGTIDHGDIAFVDRTVRHFDGDGVYVLVWGNGLMIKRLQALPWGGMKIKSDNPNYETVDVVGDDVNRITICGRVTGSWKVRRI
jgi:phage repressor protein C with HTH and peptisase S24 domain